MRGEPYANRKKNNKKNGERERRKTNPLKTVPGCIKKHKFFNPAKAMENIRVPFTSISFRRSALARISSAHITVAILQVQNLQHVLEWRDLQDNSRSNRML
ncbi:hypothetical protein CEXT_79771 [Caerostris extrusa]|uniref:Uncharacterized protein n=1 Tax=Caerostris extrusa TaxID=172846 RepID=A0AAV4T979_CAEEX|nr:hypothetical protein CEXT_79771 [Caerostris extrusa]